MEILKNAAYLTPFNRRVVAVLALVATLSSVSVQAADAQNVLPAAPTWTAMTVQGAAKSQGMVVPSDAPSKDVTQVQSAPKKKWNMVNAPDLVTPVEHSSEPAVRTVVVPATAYTSTLNECDSTPFTTANGTQVRDGIVAANFLKLGTRIRIPEYFGDKVFEVQDRMNARYDQRIDIWMLSAKDMNNWGVRKVKIEVLP